MPKSLRVSLTLSGGASLGAYQAGATAALLVALEHLRDEQRLDVRVDAVGGASAGAIVGLMAAYSLLEGVSGCDVLHEAWVERVSIDTLLRRGSRGPLSLEGVRAELPDVLKTGQRAPGQKHALALHVALTGLRGLTYELEGVRREPISAVTFADWMDFVLEPGGGPRQYFEPRLRSPFDAVLASASHPGAFAPRVLDRRADREEYERQGVANLPRSGWLWYTDGGLVQSEPVGRTLSAARRIEGPADARRLNLMIDPRSEEPTDAEEWSDRDYDATWAGGLSRALAVLPEQALYEDLRKLQRDNRRLEWLAALERTVGDHLDERAAEGLRRLIETIDGERDDLRGGDAGHAAPDADAPAAELVRAAIERISGLAGKHRVDVDVISPLLLAGRDDFDKVGDLLAGEMIGDFGGFLQAELRRSDFALGYESALAWAPDGLAACDLPEAAVEGAVGAVRESKPEDWEEVRRGETSGRDLPWRARLRLASFLLRGIRALVRS